MFNVAKYIEQCMQSVLAQTYKNFEIICVDDGCTDSTLDKLNQFTDPRIKIIKQKNRGLSGARNTGILAARGIYIALLDADDFWASEKLAKHVNHLNRHPEVGVSYCPSLFVDEQGKLMGIGQFPKLKRITSKDVFCRNPVGNGSAPVIRRRLLHDIATVGPKTSRRYVFDENLRQSEDIELWLRITLQGKWKFEGISSPLTYYRVNNTGLSADLTKQYASWCFAVKKNMPGNQIFFKRYLSLARAYQYRYLSRRAISANDSWQALKLIHKAIMTQPRILIEEPHRTALTYGCALTSLLPVWLYRALEKKAMVFMRRRTPLSL
jgi:glycosyltransferase involved in cell wall biosynthesis